MSDIDEEAKLNKIGRLLETGGTMLAQHCESCGAPMFRFKGKVLCPVCDNAAETEGRTAARTPKKPDKEKPETVSVSTFPESIGLQGAPQHPPSFYGEMRSSAASGPMISRETDQFIRSTIINKIVQLCLDLQRETDLGRIKQQLEAIESGTRALNNISR